MSSPAPSERREAGIAAPPPPPSANPRLPPLPQAGVLVPGTLGWAPIPAWLLADADPLGDAALFAGHEAAPVELAVAALAARLPQDVVPAAAAQALTVVHARAGLVAQAPLSAQGVQGRFSLAEVG